MDLEPALKKLGRVVAAVERGEAPYSVLEIAVYGSVARGEEKVADLDLYFQLDRESVPGEDLLRETLPSSGPGVLKRLRKALKKYPQERVEITWGFDPWERQREDFARPEDIDHRVDEELARLDRQDGELPKSWKEARARLERRRQKVKAKEYEWPAPGIVVYRKAGGPDSSVEEIIKHTTGRNSQYRKRPD